MKAKKYIAIICIITIAISVLSGCGNYGSKGQVADKTHSVVDMSGRTVEVPDSISRYVVLWVGAVDFAIMFDHGEHMVGCSDTAASYTYFETACKNYDNLILFNKNAITVEGVLQTEADVVFYRGSDHSELAEQLSAAGISAIDVEFNDYEELIAAMQIMADVFGTEYAANQCANYRKYVEESIAEASKIASSVSEKRSALGIRDTSDLRAYGANRFAGRWVTLCGGKYALNEGDPDGYVNLTKEQLLSYDPDVLVFIIPGEAAKFKNDPQWSSLSAVSNNCVYENPSIIGTWSNHGAEFVLQFWWAIDILYPELVNYETCSIVKDFYRTFFDLTLDDKEILQVIQRD